MLDLSLSSFLLNVLAGLLVLIIYDWLKNRGGK